MGLVFTTQTPSHSSLSTDVDYAEDVLFLRKSIPECHYFRRAAVASLGDCILQRLPVAYDGNANRRLGGSLSCALSDRLFEKLTRLHSARTPGIDVSEGEEGAMTIDEAGDDRLVR